MRGSEPASTEDATQTRRLANGAFLGDGFSDNAGLSANSRQGFMASVHAAQDTGITIRDRVATALG